ncbi:MAG: DnaJ domain-containing protein [Myxococcaceae bacterium]
MTEPSAAQALLSACATRSTGRLSLLAATGRCSELWIADGDVVGAQMGFAYQSVAQSLWRMGRLGSEQLDAWWSRNEGETPSDETLAAFGVTRDEAARYQLLVQVGELATQAETTRFEAGEVPGSGVRISGPAAVRWAFQAQGSEKTGQRFHCMNVDACRPWVASEDELGFLQQFAEFKSADDALPNERALLRVLSEVGLVDVLSEEAWLRTVATAAVTAPTPPPSPAVEITELGAADEVAADSEPTAQAISPLTEASWAELVDAPPVAQVLIEAETPAQVEVLPLTAEEAIDFAPETTGQSAEEATGQGEGAQAELQREMDEALRRASQTQTDNWLDSTQGSEPSWVDTTPTDTVLSPLARETPAVSELPEEWAELSSPAGSPDRAEDLPQSLSIEPPTRPRSDEDLWRLLEFSRSEPTDLALSFEKALAQVDAELEALVGTFSTPEPPVEAEIESSDFSDFSDQTFDNDPIDEAELAGDPTDPGEASRARRQRLLRRAMENLGAFGQRSTPAPAAPLNADVAEPRPAAPVETAAPAIAEATGETAQLAELIAQRHAALATKPDHFALLGVSRSVTKDGVKTAFLGLAKTFHPDRLPQSLGHLASKMTALFEAIRESYEVLYDDARRGDYLKRLVAKEEAAAPLSQPDADPQELYKRGEQAMKKRDFAQAEQMFGRAHDLKPTATYLAAQAWAIYMDPERKQELPKAKTFMQEALRLDSRCDRALYQLGVVARVEGDLDKAERHFRDAVSANAKHVEAAQELRLIEMRRRKK